MEGKESESRYQTMRGEERERERERERGKESMPSLRGKRSRKENDFLSVCVSE